MHVHSTIYFKNHLYVRLCFTKSYIRQLVCISFSRAYKNSTLKSKKNFGIEFETYFYSLFHFLLSKKKIRITDHCCIGHCCTTFRNFRSASLLKITLFKYATIFNCLCVKFRSFRDILHMF